MAGLAAADATSAGRVLIMVNVAGQIARFAILTVFVENARSATDAETELTTRAAPVIRLTGKLASKMANSVDGDTNIAVADFFHLEQLNF